MAEKFSKFRDPGTGIQVFLTPVAASTSSSSSASSSSSLLSLFLTPLFVILGVFRSVIGGLFWGLYLLSGNNGLLRIVLWCLGFISFSVETVVAGSGGRRGGSKTVVEKNTAKGKGDLIVANHSAWIDLLILSNLYPGTRFIVPVIPDGIKIEPIQVKEAAAATGKRGTPKKNAMSANTRIVTPSSPSPAVSSQDIPIQGYTILSLTQTLPFIGGLPPSPSQLNNPTIHPDLSSLLKTSTTPLIIFPEVVTSNNRALLSFTLPPTIPQALKGTTITTIKYSPPTSTSTTSIYSVPSPSNSKFKHLLNILFLSNPIRSVTIRTTFVERENANGGENWNEDLAEKMSNLGRSKRTGITWKAKTEFLSMIQSKHQKRS